jgi:hypothetical protein
MTNAPQELDRRGPLRTGSSDYKYVIWVFYAALSLGLLATSLWIEPRHAMVALLWAMACFVGGGALGFIFGIPKVLQQGGSAQPDGGAGPGATASGVNYRQEVNTNLTEISDWLTKMIVGVSLVNLKEMPPLVLKVARVFAAGMSPSDPGRDFLPYSVGVIMFFTVLGLLFGYLSTRLYLAPAFARADVSAATQLAVESQGAEVESIKSELAVLKGMKAEGAPAPSQGQAPSARDQVLAAAQQALDADAIPDVAARVAGKDRAANEIARLVLDGAITRDWLVEEARRESLNRRQDALIAGLAVVVNTAPESEDFQRLVRVAPLAVWPSTHHKICVAIGKLFAARVATESEVPQAGKLLRILWTNADVPLQRRIRETAALIQRSTGVGITLTDG